MKTKEEESRREFLIKAGKMALYIPPAMMVLMHPSRDALACSVKPSCSTCGGIQTSSLFYSGEHHYSRHRRRRR